jgi:hypothetical protein
MIAVKLHGFGRLGYQPGGAQIQDRENSGPIEEVAVRRTPSYERHPNSLRYWI